MDFNNFWCKHFWHNWPSNDRYNFHLNQCLLLHYLGKSKQATCTFKWTKNFNEFYIFGPVFPNSQSITLFDCCAAECLPDDLQKCWWIQKVIGEVWIVLEQNIIDPAVNERRNHLCACGHVIGWQFEHFLPQAVEKNRQLDKLSTYVTKMWKMCFMSYFD